MNITCNQPWPRYHLLIQLLVYFEASLVKDSLRIIYYSTMRIGPGQLSSMIRIIWAIARLAGNGLIMKEPGFILWNPFII